jgi:hypothetical protein
MICCCCRACVSLGRGETGLRCARTPAANTHRSPGGLQQWRGPTVPPPTLPHDPRTLNSYRWSRRRGVTARDGDALSPVTVGTTSLSGGQPIRANQPFALDRLLPARLLWPASHAMDKDWREPLTVSEIPDTEQLGAFFMYLVGAFRRSVVAPVRAVDGGLRMSDWSSPSHVASPHGLENRT